MSVEEIIKQVEDDLVLCEGEGGWVEMGGPGSGHWGHAGRKGKRGGSAPSKGIGAIGKKILKDKPYLVVKNNPLSGKPTLNDEELDAVKRAIQGIELPGFIGTGEIGYTFLGGRKPPKGERELATASGSIIFINRHPGVFDNITQLRNTLAHEFGHIVLRNKRPIKTAFESSFGLGPYKSGTFGITSVYHLQNSSEAFSKLFSKYATGQDVPNAISRFMTDHVYGEKETS